jgi:hypothetical protein
MYAASSAAADNSLIIVGVCASGTVGKKWPGHYILFTSGIRVQTAGGRPAVLL